MTKDQRWLLIALAVIALIYLLPKFKGTPAPGVSTGGGALPDYATGNPNQPYWNGD